jgi:hypothetical protein
LLGLAVDHEGNFCVADFYNNDVRKVEASALSLKIKERNPAHPTRHFRGELCFTEK